MITCKVAKPDGMGPYFHVVVWRKRGNPTLEFDLQTSVFSDYEDAKEFSERIKLNGNMVITIDLGVDWTRKQQSNGEVYVPIASTHRIPLSEDIA